MGKKRKVPEHKEESRMVKVVDDWCPNYPGDEVELAIVFHEMAEYSGQRRPYYLVRIRAWGYDDFGVELDYVTQSCECGYGRYNFWKKYIFDRVPDGVDKQWFYEHGFAPA